MTSPFRPRSTLRTSQWLGGLALLCWLGAEGTTQAQPSVELTWEAPDDCPQRNEVLERVREIAGPAYAERLGFRAQGKVRSIAGRYELELSVQTAKNSKERSFTSKNCDDLARATAVVLGLELKHADAEPDTSVNPKPTESAAEQEGIAGEASEGRTLAETAPAASASDNAAQSSPLSAENEAAQARTPTESASGTRNGFVVAPQVGIGAGALPKLAVPVGLALGARFDPFCIYLAGRYEGSQKVTSELDPDVAAQVTLYAARASLFYGWTQGAFEYNAGLTAGAGRVAAKGLGSNLNSAAASQLFGFAGPTVSARWFIGNWLTFSAVAAAEYHFSRPAVTVQPLGTIYGFGVGQLWLVVGPEFIF